MRSINQKKRGEKECRGGVGYSTAAKRGKEYTTRNTLYSVLTARGDFRRRCTGPLRYSMFLTASKTRSVRTCVNSSGWNDHVESNDDLPEDDDSMRAMPGLANDT